ncbi:MAG: DUF1648 domain-containing protein [Candidatus Krumholzibacteriia bacterium]
MPSPRTIFVLLLIVAALQCAFYYPRLPGTVASHFNGEGYPNDWSSKSVFFGIILAIAAMNAFFFLVMPGWFPRFSQARMNLPHKEYWLAPERLQETHRYIRTQTLWFGVASMVLMIGVTQMAIEANLSTQPALSPGAFKLLIAYFVFVAAWLVRFFVRFLRPRPEDGNGTP